MYLHFVFPTGIPKIKVPHISSCWKTFMHWPQNFKLYTVDTFCYSLSLEQFHVSADRLTMNKERGHHCQLICFIYYDYDVYSSIINPKKINLDNYATYSSPMHLLRRCNSTKVKDTKHLERVIKSDFHYKVVSLRSNRWVSGWN